MKTFWHKCPICHGRQFRAGRRCYHCGGDGCVLVVEVPERLLLDVIGGAWEEHENQYREQIGDLYAKITQAAKRLKEVRK